MNYTKNLLLQHFTKTYKHVSALCFVFSIIRISEQCTKRYIINLHSAESNLCCYGYIKYENEFTY